MSFPTNKLADLFSQAMDEAGVKMTSRLDRVEQVGIGGYRITFTVKPTDAPKINPFTVGIRFTLGRRMYEVTGQNLRKWKFPVQVKRLPDGKRFCVTTKSVEDGYLPASTRTRGYPAVEEK